MIEVVVEGRRQVAKFLGEAEPDEGRILAPRDEFLKENIAMDDEDLPVGEVEVVLAGEIGVVVTGDVSNAGDAPVEKVCDSGAD